MKIGNKEFFGHTYIMGILNVTEDSFSDGGKYSDIDRALKHTEEMIKDGADIIDVGGESTRPGYTMISDDEEISHVAPVIEKIKANFDIPVSVDTYKSRVCHAAAQAGADMINDIWGFQYDADMAKTAAEFNMSACLMHNSKTGIYNNLMTDIAAFLKTSVQIANDAGVSEIMIDPGVGFGKTYEQNLLIMRNLDCLTSGDIPVLLGGSRKSVIGKALNGAAADERLEGTIAASVWAAVKGCLFVRVHDIKENKRAILTAERIMGK